MKQTVSILRLLTIGLGVGLVSFVAIVHWLIPPTAPGANATMYWAILGGLAFSELVAYFAVRAALVGGAQQRFSVEPARMGESTFANLYFTVTIIGLALAESVGLFATILLMILGDPRLLLFVGAALAAILAQFPTENGYKAFVQRITGAWPMAS